MTKASDNVFPRLLVSEGGSTSTPAANNVTVYAKANGLLYSKDDAGVETLVSGGATATRASLGLDTTDSPQFAGVNIGAATDTTVTRTGAGDIAVEGNALYRAGGTDVPIADGGTGASTATAAFDALSPMTTAGDLIVGGASGTRTRLAAGATSGHVLTSTGSGSAPSWQAAAGGGGGSLVWLQRQTASASATLDFTSFISATYDTYQFEFTNIIGATDAALFYMRMGTGVGPTYDAGTNYHWLGWLAVASAAGATGASSGANQITLLSAVDTGATLMSINGTVKLYNPAGAVLWKPVTGQLSYMDNLNNVPGMTTIGGAYRSATAVTGIRFLMSTGNITSGTIDVYGLTHA